MDCDVCDIRSSVGFCHECKKLLCEVCGAECAVCGKLLCDEHVEETRHGRQLCAECMAERRARRHRERRRAEGEREGGHSFAALDGEEGRPADGDESVDDALDERILLASGRKKRDPWLRSLYLSSPGVVLLIVMMSFPLMHYILHPWLSLLTLFFGVLGGVRGLLGFYADKYHERVVLNVIACCAAFLVCIAGLVLLLYPESPFDLWHSLGMEPSR
ncbi:MAG: hypothetical protein GWP08_05335 [Nitrospiraceae bacterium]|nr:hypothetical protein [Nitrospiraceae bacterium]